jgi:hypothetical protein
MAKTPEQSTEVARQAPREVWSPEEMLAAIVGGTLEDNLAAMRRAGIIDDQNQFTEAYKRGGQRLTRAADYRPKELRGRG